MRCLLLLTALLGAARAVPFFRVDFPEHRADLESGPEVVPDEDPSEPGAVFAFQLPKIDLSALFKPLRVFAGVNVDHHPSAVAAERVEPNCELGKFDLTDEEFDVVMDCQKLYAGSDVELKECILTKLPKTSNTLRTFLDREEFGVSSLSSSFNLALIDGEFTQKRSVEFRLCPRDEVNSIDAVEEIVPVEVVDPDRVDVPVPEGVIPVMAPEGVAPPSRPLFSFPPLRLPDFGEIFSQAFGPVFRPPAPEEGGEEAGPGGLFASVLNPFAVRRPEGQQGFFGSLFPQIAAVVPQGPNVDMKNCASKKFEVSRSVFNVANRCQYANDYRKCLSMDLAGDDSAKALLEFAVDPDYSIVASSFSSFQASFDLHEASRKNVIDLRRCANIEVTVDEAADAAAAAADPEEAASVPSPEAPEVVPEAPEVALEDPELAPEVPELTPEVPELTPEVPELAPEAPESAPEAPELAPEVSESAEATPEAPEVIAETPELVPELPELAPEAPAEPLTEAEKASAEPLTEAEKASSEPLTEAEKASSEPLTEAEKASSELESPAEESKPKDIESKGYEAIEP